MKRIDKLTDDADQSCVLISERGQNIPFHLRYLPTQNSWLFDISYQGWALNGAILTVSPNALRDFKNQIPFGLAVTSNDELDPFYLNDFSSQRIKIYLLSAEEVDLIEARLYT